MTRLGPEELESLREEGRSEALRREFRASAQAHQAAARDTAIGLEEILHWIDQLRAAFGEPAVDFKPWRGDDFRL